MDSGLGATGGGGGATGGGMVSAGGGGVGSGAATATGALGGQPELRPLCSFACSPTSGCQHMRPSSKTGESLGARFLPWGDHRSTAKRLLRAAHRVSAVQALVASAVAHRDVAAAVADRRVAHHLFELRVERARHAFVSVGGCRSEGAPIGDLGAAASYVMSSALSIRQSRR